LGRFGHLAWLALLLLSFCSLCANAETPAAAFDAANKLFEQEKYPEAAAAYEKLLQSGQASAAVYFNLGNVFFKSGQIGRAIAAYRQAERLTPRDPDVRANLQFARNQTQGPTQSPSRWQRWLGRLSLDEWTLLADGAVWFWLLLLAVGQWRPALRNALRGYVAALACAAALLGSCLAASWYQRDHSPAAIVIAPDVVIRNSPFDESKNAFTAHDGAELQVLDQKDDWLQVSAVGRTGWIRRSQVLLAPRS